LAQLPHFPQQLNSCQVLVRFFVRLIILSSFAAFGSIGFTRSFAALLWMAIILCAVVGIMRREPVLHASLNHWDETVAFAALYTLVSGLDQHLSS
jgi:hypothetical protein